MSNDRFQDSDKKIEPSYLSALSFDFPLKSKNYFSISNTFNISLNAHSDRESDSNSKESGSGNIKDVKDIRKDSNLRNKVIINQLTHFNNKTHFAI
jgi:hypothetical protein